MNSAGRRLAQGYLFRIGLLVALLLAGCGGLGQPGHTITPVPPPASPTGTPTTLWFPATNTPTAMPTLVILPTQELHPGLGEVLFRDAFDQPELWNMPSVLNTRISLADNQLSMTIAEDKPSTVIYSLRKEPILADFYAEVTVRLGLCRDRDQYGMLFRALSAGNYYRFALNCNGEIRLERVSGGIGFPVQNWLPSGDAPPGAPGEVRLAIWAVGTEIRLFINDRLQMDHLDRTYSQGVLGLFIGTGGSNPLSAVFSDLVVYPVSFASPTPSATPSRTPTPTRTPRPTP